MRFPTQQQRPRKVQATSFPAPTGGWISNRNISMARQPNMPPGAAILENWFPTAMAIMVRRGSVQFADLDNDNPVRSLFTYSSGVQEEMFAATDAGIFDASTETDTGVTVTNGDWSFVQFGTAGGDFLIGVNGTDDALEYDGTSWSTATLTTSGTVTSKDLVQVFVYKQRLYFVQKDSLSLWYLDVDSKSGALTELPLSGVFTRGGTIAFGQAWSLDTGAAGGLSEQMVIVSSEGEVVVYQGLYPGDTDSWQKVGQYRSGRPLGRKAFIRAGGDIMVATTVGFVSLAQASRLDYAALGMNAASFEIEDAWADAVRRYGQDNWRCLVWPDGQMVMVAPPASVDNPPVVFVANSNTRAWCIFTGWDVTALETFKGRLFFGTQGGIVKEGWVGGNDCGQFYSASALPLFEDLGAPASLKIVRSARAILKSAAEVEERLTAVFDYNLTLPSPPGAPLVSGSDVWESAIWDEAVWNAEAMTLHKADWRSVGGSGHDVSIAVQVTSGAAIPLDAELARIDLTFETADVVT